MAFTSLPRNYFQVNFSGNLAIITAERHLRDPTLSLLKGNSTIGAQRPTACLSKARGFITKQSQNRASPGFLSVQYPSSTQAGTQGGQGNASPTRTNEE